MTSCSAEALCDCGVGSIRVRTPEFSGNAVVPRDFHVIKQPPPSMVFLQRVGLHWAPRSLGVFLFLIRVLSRVHAPTAGSEALTVLTVVSVFLPRCGVHRQPWGAPLCPGLLPEKAEWNLCCKQAAGGFFIHLENSL